MISAGLSKARLGRMHDVMAGYVEKNEVPGIVTLVNRRGETHVDVLGTQAFDSPEPMRRDTIFRVTSMTKPITAAAAMILVEECRLRLDEPVTGLLPELADRRVLRRIDGPVDDTVPAERPITVRDVLTFRLGYGLILEPKDGYPIHAAQDALQLALGKPKPPSPYTSDEWISTFATLPLLHQPGEKWMYHTGAQVLGVLIERASGQSLDRFLRERIFEPLGMHDTGFSVPPAKMDRLSTSYWVDYATGTLEVYDEAAGGQHANPPVFHDGAAGLVSTADDYLAFGRMLLNKGACEGERILSRASVEMMTTDQLTPEQKARSGFFPGYWDNRGWGFGLSVVTNRDILAATPGRFGWDGGFTTSWYCDPAEDMVAILMAQRLAPPSSTGLYVDFWTSVYQAIDD
ncbi:CubicO group peptidase (beta-lactamase class C family) [Actinoalloteichus hoggarensis]|uniref:Esterase EstB n=1 Tax=Actinoalloteichus hoggarensis TaxID=1470176 RepID=A0A221W4W5_9PSEU|nr:serine hydrolase domain-containing protein [Actinoalloteichus hoggarensis]ASO20932.1 Esterase EstB [Actinoalloteichus hoggarensis]MBB5920862.1 CubicO group peptidase (beta-lactamase class C family) [Actinoalloteichus hoggarensis]